MPEAAMDEQDRPLSRKNKVGTARERYIMPPALHSHSSEKCVRVQLRRGVSRPYARHEFPALTWCQGVLQAGGDGAIGHGVMCLNTVITKLSCLVTQRVSQQADDCIFGIQTGG